MRLKIAVLAPIPSDRDRTAVSVNAWTAAKQADAVSEVPTQLVEPLHDPHVANVLGRERQVAERPAAGGRSVSSG